MKQYKRNLLELLVILLFFFLPFERIPTLELFGFTIKISYIISILMLIISASKFKFWKIININNSNRSLGLFWGTALIGSLFFSPDMKRSLTILSLWLFVFLIYYLLTYITDSRIREKIYSAILISTAVVCLFGIFQFIGDSLGLSQHLTGLRIQYTKIIMGFPRVQSVALEPLYYANFLMVPFFLSVYRYITSKANLNIYLFLSALILTNIILTISRGAYIALTISSIVFVIYLFCTRALNSYRKILGLTSIIIFSLALSYIMITKLNGKQAATNFAEHSVVENVESDGSAFDRIGTYKLALDLFEEKPILGNGVGSFGLLLPHATNAMDQDKTNNYGIVNNIYLEILTETGFVGFLLFSIFIFFYLKELWQTFQNKDQNQRLVMFSLFCGIFAIFVQYNFFSTLYIIYIWAFLALLKSYAAPTQ